MKKRKVYALIFVMTLAMMMCVLTACDTSIEEVETTIYLEYPEDMQEMGFTEPLELESVPERAVILTAGPELALYELGVGIVGYYDSIVVETPQEIQDTATKFINMSDTFDTEAVVSLEPDIIFLLYTYEDTYGELFESMGIPVYYLNGAHGIAYDAIKMQTQAFVDAFSQEEEVGEEIMSRFTDLEERMAELGDKYADIDVLVMMSADYGVAVFHYVQTSNGSLRNMLDMLNFNTVGVEEFNSSGMVSLDREYALANWEPDYIFFATMGEDYESAQEEADMMTSGDNDEDQFWETLTADMCGEIIGLPVLYTSGGGIQVVDTINELIDYLEDLIGY